MEGREVRRNLRMSMPCRVVVCIPTLNAGRTLPAVLAGLRVQTLQPDELNIIDSGSADGTAAIAHGAGGRLTTISRQEFDHGGTRQLAVDLVPEAEVLVFLTQDAVLADPESLARLLACFADPAVGAAYGRQLPRPGAGPIEAHARLFNYPEQSRVKSLADAPELGIKTAFISNSFAAYRRTALEQVGGFPLRTICTEDTHAAARMLLAGWRVAYCAEATVYHSHAYGYLDEFRRYFDIGYFYGSETWIRQAFGAATGEGGRFVRSELAYLLRHRPLLIPSALMRTLFKLAGYRLGAQAERLPFPVRRFLGMNRNYWRR